MSGQVQEKMWCEEMDIWFLNIHHASRIPKHLEIYQTIVQPSQWLKSSTVLNSDSDSMRSLVVPTTCNQDLGWCFRRLVFI
jgi:hypothetical protein